MKSLCRRPKHCRSRYFSSVVWAVMMLICGHWHHTTLQGFCQALTFQRRQTILASESAAWRKHLPKTAASNQQHRSTFSMTRRTVGTTTDLNGNNQTQGDEIRCSSSKSFVPSKSVDNVNDSLFRHKNGRVHENSTDTYHHHDRNNNTLSSLAASVQTQVLDVMGVHFSRHQTLTHPFVHVVVSVSGGCDSVALLHACMEWKRQQMLQETRFLSKFHVVHFHHRQRPIDADLDCQLVKDLVAEYNTQEDTMIASCHIEDWEDYVDGNVSTNFSQDKARQWRQTKLLEYATSQVQSTQEHNIHASTIGIILTAHHQDDSYESALLKLLRGVHLLNWKGMDPFMQLKAPAAPVPMRIGNSCSNTNDTAQLQPIYLARPFLEHSKQSLMEYLQKRNLQWREDTSNKLNKYLRNRVRNELIPLLQDMTDGAFLGKRLPNLLEQSYEMARDVNDRVNEYMNHYQPDAMALGLWTIHKESNSESQLIYSQALHQWITYRMVELSSANAGCNREHMVTYNLLQRVMEQLQEYPDRNQWELEMGNKYSVMRKGNVLRVVLAEPDKAMKTKKPPRVTWKWTIVHCAETQSSIPDVITLCLPQSMVSSDLSFFSTTISDASQAGFFGDESGVSLRFLPPWKSKPVKVRQFLHGQNIPLHQRDAIPMLFAVTQQSSPTLVAILVKPDKWIADKRYNLQTDTKDRAMDSYLQLQLTLGTIDA